jgi:hypothetical protein
MTITIRVRDANGGLPLPEATVAGTLAGASVFTLTTDGVGRASYTDEAQRLVGQTVLIALYHPQYAPLSRPITVGDDSTTVDVFYWPRCQSSSGHRARLKRAVAAAVAAVVIGAVPIWYFYWYLVAVPQLACKPLAQAKQELNRAGLSTGNILSRQRTASPMRRYSSSTGMINNRKP